MYLNVNVENIPSYVRNGAVVGQQLLLVLNLLH